MKPTQLLENWKNLKQFKRAFCKYFETIKNKQILSLNRLTENIKK